MTIFLDATSRCRKENISADCTDVHLSTLTGCKLTLAIEVDAVSCKKANTWGLADINN